MGGRPQRCLRRGDRAAVRLGAGRRRHGAADLFAAGVIDPADFITDRYPLARHADAIEAFKAGTGLKTQVLPHGL